MPNLDTQRWFVEVDQLVHIHNDERPDGAPVLQLTSSSSKRKVSLWAHFDWSRRRKHVHGIWKMKQTVLRIAFGSLFRNDRELSEAVRAACERDCPPDSRIDVPGEGKQIWVQRAAPSLTQRLYPLEQREAVLTGLEWFSELAAWANRHFPGR